MVTRIDKAIVAGIMAAVAVLSTAQAAGVPIEGTIWIQAGVAALVAALGVWLVPNKPAAV